MTLLIFEPENKIKRQFFWKSIARFFANSPDWTQVCTRTTSGYGLSMVKFSWKLDKMNKFL